MTSRFLKIAKLLHRATNGPSDYSIAKIAAMNIPIKSWEDLEEKFSDHNSLIKDSWENYVDSFGQDGVRTKDIKSFLDFFNKRGLERLSDEARVEEENLLPEMKQLLKELGPKKEVGSGSFESSSQGVFDSGSPKWNEGGYENGPSHHQNRPGRTLTKWESNNAWDLFGAVGTKVYSLTKGKVGAVIQSSDRAYNIFGTHISVTGVEGYPNVFYTHLQNVVVKAGDMIEVGTLLGQITKPKMEGMDPHVHIGVENDTISSLITSSGKFKKYKKKNPLEKLFS